MKRPPKKWFNDCVESVEKKAPDIEDAKALCGWIWHHHAKYTTKRQILQAESKRTQKRKVKKMGKKYGKIGPPKSAKRRRWLAKIRKKR